MSQISFISVIKRLHLISQPPLLIPCCFTSSQTSNSLTTQFQTTNLQQNPLSRFQYCSLLQFPINPHFSAIKTTPFCSQSLSLTKFAEPDCDLACFESDEVYKTIMSNINKPMETALETMDLKLTTELVDGVLFKLRCKEKIAFRFFTWAGHQENYTHQPQTYNAMIDLLSDTEYRVKQFRIVIDMLDYMKRKGKKNVPIEVLLRILRNYKEKYLHHLAKFAKKHKIRVKTQPEIHAFNYLLDSLCKCCLVEEAEVLFNKVKNRVEPDAKTYNVLFFGWCRVRNVAKGKQVLEEMIKLGHEPESFTYITALDTYCRCGMLSEAVTLFDFMRTKGTTMSSPTAKTYAIMIVAFAKCGKMEESFRFIDEMRKSGCLPDVSTYKELIEGMCLVGKIDEAYKFLEEMGNKGYPADIVTYNCFLKVLCDLRKEKEALKLYGIMNEMGCAPSVQTFNMLIVMYFEIGKPDGAFEAWNEMEKRYCARNLDTYCVMIEGLFCCDKTEDACVLLEDVINDGKQLPYRMFESFLKHLSDIGDLQAIQRLSKHMRKSNSPTIARRFADGQKSKSSRLRGK